MLAISINSLLTDPSWWFTSVFVALLISVLAGVFIIWVPKIFGRFSSALRQRRNETEKRESMLASLLSSQPNLYVSSFLRLILDIIIVLSLVAMSLAIGPLHVFYQAHPDYDPIGKFLPGMANWIVGISGMIAILAVTFKGYRIYRRSRILHRVHCMIRSEFISDIRRAFEEVEGTLTKTEEAEQDGGGQPATRSKLE
jgi:hypothetical protein